MDTTEAQQKSAAIGAAVDGLVAKVEENLDGVETDDMAVPKAMIAVGEAIAEIAPDFSVEAYLMGGFVAAAQSVSDVLS